jgi:Spy/CpxP family protein refolding chaperone
MDTIGSQTLQICRRLYIFLPSTITTTAQYQETRAKALAEASAKADSPLALLRARTERDLYLLLTPEQRVQMLDRRRERLTHGPGGPPTP